jgi:hypothetical protein
MINIFHMDKGWGGRSIFHLNKYSNSRYFSSSYHALHLGTGEVDKWKKHIVEVA